MISDEDFLFPKGIQIMDYSDRVQDTKEERVIYKCYQCKHQYSPHLSKKCPKCGCEYINRYKEFFVRMWPMVKSFKITIGKDGVE